VAKRTEGRCVPSALGCGDGLKGFATARQQLIELYP